MFSRKHIKGDTAGALSVTALSVPLALGTGLIAFAPLISENSSVWAPQAIMYALTSVVFSSLVQLVARANPIQYFGLSTASAVLLADFVTAAKSQEAIAALSKTDPNLYIALLLGGMAACIFFSGLFNVIYGFLRLGAVIKLFPQPVLAGAINGIAVLLISREIQQWLPENLANMVPTAIILIVLIVALVTRAKTPAFPASVSALLVGGLVYWLVGSFTSLETGGMFGLLNQNLPKPDGVNHVVTLVKHDVFVSLILPILGHAFLISIITAITTLVSVTTVENLTFDRLDGSKALLKSGIITLLGSCFIALPSDGSDSRIRLNYSAGGRTLLSPLIFALLAALFATVLAPYSGLVPKTVISGLVIYMSVLLVDKLTIEFLPRIFKSESSQESKPLRNHLLISVFTAIMTLSVGLLPALLAGMSLALFFFLLESQTNIIYRQTSSDIVPSKTIRSVEAIKLLQDHGGRIQVLELQGPLFFGSIDALTKIVENLKNEVDFLILDFTKVSFSDSSAAMILKRLMSKYASLQKKILVSQIKSGSQVRSILQQFDLFTENDRAIFSTLNEAQTFAEDELLKILGYERSGLGEMAFADAILLQNLTPKEIKQLEKHAIRKVFQHGEILMNEGDDPDGIYIIAKGRAVVQKITETGTAISIVRFGAGVSVGETVLLTKGSRSATVRSEGETTCYILSMKLLAAIEKQAPNMMIKILMNVGSATAKRLAVATNTIKELEQ